MKKNSCSILVINEPINTGSNDHDDDYLDTIKNNKGKKVKKFEKYKPKVSNQKETNIEGAENKVKSLLSLFLHNIETEEKNDVDTNRLFLNEIESAKRRNSNALLDKKEEFIKIGTINSLSQNYIRANSLQFAICDEKNVIKKRKTIKKNQDKSNFYKSKRKGSLIKDNNDINESGYSRSSIDISSNQNNVIKKTKTNSPEIGSKNNLKTVNSININLSPNRKNIKNSPIHRNATVRTEKEFTERKLRKKMKNSFKISNKIKKIAWKDEINGESILSNDNRSIIKKLTEDKNEIKTEEQLRGSSLVIKNLEGSDVISSRVNKNKTNSIIRTSNISASKRNETSSIKTSNISSSKSSLIGSIIKKRKIIPTNKGFRGIMRAITSSSGMQNCLTKKDTKKLLRVQTALKSLQEQIKKTIILRPEDLVIDFSEKIKPFIKKEKIISNKEKNEPVKKLSSQSIISQLSKKNESDISKKRPSTNIKIPEDISIMIQKTDNNSDQTYQIASNNLLKNESIEELHEDISQSKFIQLHEKHRIFIHRNQVYDSLDDEEVEDEVSNYIYFNPNSKFMLMFDAILLLFTLFSLYWTPLYLAHSLNFCNGKNLTFVNVINLLIEFMNLLDLVFGFFKAYYNFEEQLIKKNSIIVKNYLSGWFIIDLISAIPFYSLFKFQEMKCNSLVLSNHHYNSILHNLNYLYMCNRILKIIKVFFKNQAYYFLVNNYRERNRFLKLTIKCIRMGCLLSAFHFCACLYIFIGRNSYPNWILYTKLEIKSFIEIYICAIYMLLTTLTTVGYGDITCYSSQERIFQLFLLIIGIMSYSYAVSSFSSYVQKKNEKSVEYEKRKKILDDIKLNNPNLPESLYDRILRYLKYKTLSEKRDKSIILDCLPVGLKNNLIYEMYKPIIQNFIFFKNFENADFIVRVILSFRPVIAIKNDILVNEGDIVEDIMFVKKGILSVELPINVENPQENVEKYFNMTILRIEKGPELEKVGETTVINSNINANMKIKNTNILGKTLIPGEDIEKKITKIKTDNKKKYDKTTYVKILNIRENEHFGDVLMFLEKRSPLRVRVRSKKTELFFLKKTDAVKISSIYQNIWTRINKKSVFNFEQIKKSIYKIVEIYCAFKTLKTFNENSENIKKAKAYRKTVSIRKRKLKLESEIDKKIKSKSEKKLINMKNKDSDDSIIETNLYRNISVKKFSSKTPIINSNSFSDESDSGDSNDSNESDSEEYSNQKNNSNRKKNTSDSKLLNAYNGNYKFYKGRNNKNNLNVIDSIIDEEPGKEGTITPMKKNELISSKNSSKIDFRKVNSIQQVFKHSPSLKTYTEVNSKSFCSHEIKCISEKEEFEEKDKDDDIVNKSDDEKSKKIKEKEIQINIKSNKKEMYSSKCSEKNNIIDESKISSLSSDKNENLNQNSNINEMNDGDLTPFKTEDINDEIYTNEIFNITKKEENLFSRKIKASNILNQIKNNTDNFIQNNNKIQFLLDSDKDKSSINQNNTNQIQSINNNIENINTTFNMSKETNGIKKYLKNDCHCKCHSNTVNPSQLKEKITLNYSIIKTTGVEYKSLYENLNQIANYKYSPNIELQNKVKNIVTESSLLLTSPINNTNPIVEKHAINTFNKNNTFNFNKQKLQFVSTISPLSKLKNHSPTSLHRINSNTNQKFSEYDNDFNKKHKNKKRDSILSKRSETYSDASEPKMIRSPSIEKYRSKTNKFQTGIGISFNNKNNSLAGKFEIKAQKSLKKQKINNNENISTKKSKGEKCEFTNFIIEQKSTIGKNPNFFSKKKKGNLLSQINLNIEKTNQNLNNPEEFYTNYFNSILGGGADQSKFEGKRIRRRSSAICFSNKMIMSPINNMKNKKKK